MSNYERPGVLEGASAIESGETLDTSEIFAMRSESADGTLVLKALKAQEAVRLAATSSPEREAETTELMNRLQEVIKEAQETLKKLAGTTALSSTLSELVPNERPGTEESSSITADTLVENPALAEQLLEGIVAVGETSKKEDLLNHSLANEASELLKETKKEKKKGNHKLALSVAEKVLKVVLDANTFGFGGAAYEAIKECTKAYLDGRKTSQEKRKPA
ncbi:MAG: hypothetical protein KA104_02530 [Candidatus Pacebacteria bacterium]|nr:hypothetical protein [Candidatus Paceibacterota bacterium]